MKLKDLSSLLALTLLAACQSEEPMVTSNINNNITEDPYYVSIEDALAGTPTKQDSDEADNCGDIFGNLEIFYDYQ